MRRILQIVFLLLVVFWTMTSLNPAHAQEYPDFYPPVILQNDEPPPGPVTEDPQVAGIAPWGFALEFPTEFAQKIIDVIGKSFQKDHTIGTINASEHGKQVEEAAVKLVPKALQEQCLKLITYQQHMTANHVQCFYDEEGGTRHTPDEGIFHPEAIGWNRLRGGTKLLHSIMSIGVLSCDALNLYKNLPDEKVTPDNGLDCGTQMEGDHIGLYDYGDAEEIYNGSDQAQFTANLFCSPGEIEAYHRCLEEPVDPETGRRRNCSLRCSTDAHTVFSTRLPAADEINLELGKGPNGEKEGFTYAFIPSSYNLTKEHGTNDQEHTIDLPMFNGNVLTETSVYYLESSRREHMDLMNCLNTSKYDPSRPTTENNCTFDTGTDEGDDETAGGWNCKTVGEQSVAGLNKAGGQSYADRVYGSCTSGKQNAWAKCNNDVIARAKKACVDPTFALAIWLHETGASNYTCGTQLTGVKIEDFGIHGLASVPPENFSKQLDHFLTLPDRYAGCGKTLDQFISMYWFGHCVNAANAEEQGKIAQYKSELAEIYGSIAPSSSLPSWPKSTSCR